MKINVKKILKLRPVDRDGDTSPRNLYFSNLRPDEDMKKEKRKY